MNYQDAENIRKKSFGSTWTDKMLGGQGIGSSLKSTLSEKTKAVGKGIKQKFDPMNIAKKLTFGSNLAPALLGKMTGRKKEDIEFFAGKGSKPTSVGKSAAVSGVAMDFATEILGEIYKLLQQIEEDKKLTDELRNNKEEEEQSELDRRNQEIILALTGRKRKKPTRREEAKKKKEEVKAKKEAKRAEEEKKKPKPGKAEPTAKPEPVKPPTPTGPRPTIPTAAKVAAGAAVVGGLLMPSQSVAASIDKASETVGVDKSLMYAMAKQESAFNPNAAAKTSSAKGLYQFIRDTWSTMVQRYGSKYPILKEKGPDDPDANAIAGALFIKENSAELQKSGIPVNATTIYAAHFLGSGGAKKLLTADPNRSAAELLPKAAAANKPIFYDSTNQPRTVQQVVQVLFEKVGKYQDLYAKRLGEQPKPTTGMKIDESSKENAQLKKDLNAQQKQTSLEQNITTVRGSQSSPQQTPVQDDSSALEKKRRSTK
jgi:hypothetical protein